jgi:hypothetical protein
VHFHTFSLSATLTPLPRFSAAVEICLFVISHVVRSKDCDPGTVLCLSFTDFHIVNLYHTALSWICNFVHFISLVNLGCKGAVLSKLHTFCEFVRGVPNFYSNCKDALFYFVWSVFCNYFNIWTLINSEIWNIVFISIPQIELSRKPQSYYNVRSNLNSVWFFPTMLKVCFTVGQNKERLDKFRNYIKSWFNVQISVVVFIYSFSIRRCCSYKISPFFNPMANKSSSSWHLIFSSWKPFTQWIQTPIC